MLDALSLKVSAYPRLKNVLFSRRFDKRNHLVSLAPSTSPVASICRMLRFFNNEKIAI
jgi:hypothetical protein